MPKGKAKKKDDYKMKSNKKPWVISYMPSLKAANKLEEIKTVGGSYKEILDELILKK